jgi:ABC-2 type transport system permease protein
MTATAVAPAPRVANDVRVTFPRVLASEWIRLRSLRSSWITLLVTVVIVLGLGALVTAATAANWPPRDPGELVSFDPTTRSLVGTFFGQFAIGVLGVLVVTGEYSTGMIRATFTAMPRRVIVLVARAVVFAAVTIALLVPTVIGAFLLGQQLLSSKHIETHLGAPSVTRAVLGAALYMVAIGLLGVGLGWLLRHTAGAIATLVVVLLIVPIIIQFLPHPWPNDIGRWLPGGAGQAILTVRPDANLLGPWAGFGMLMLYVVAVLAAAAALLRARDV